MPDDPALYEGEYEQVEADPDQIPVRERRVVTQPYDLGIKSLMEQIENNTLHLRPLSDRPKFQRRYLWPDTLASRLVESILLNVPIPPCYLSQNDAYELDVIDGQQRIFSLFRFLDNRLKLTGLEVLDELNGKKYFEISSPVQRQIDTHTLRCIVVTNDSHPEVKFDIFERLNTNTVPLNAQELRNCIYRGALNDLCTELAEYKPWLDVLRRKSPDKRLRDEELILRFFAFHLTDLEDYRTPQKHWLNDIAKSGQTFDHDRIEQLRSVWTSTIDKCLKIFEPTECFRRLPLTNKSKVINRTLMDLIMRTVSNMTCRDVKDQAPLFRELYESLLENEEFQDLISKSVDHRSRTLRRTEIWDNEVARNLP